MSVLHNEERRLGVQSGLDTHVVPFVTPNDGISVESLCDIEACKNCDFIYPYADRNMFLCLDWTLAGSWDIYKQHWLDLLLDERSGSHNTLLWCIMLNTKKYDDIVCTLCHQKNKPRCTTDAFFNHVDKTCIGGFSHILNILLYVVCDMKWKT